MYNEDDPMIKRRFGFVPKSVLCFPKTHNIERAVNDELAKGSYASGARLSSFNNKLAEFCIKMWSRRGQSVLDPFAGRARALMVRNMNRFYTGYEVSPTAYQELYDRVHANKLVDFTNKPVLVNADSSKMTHKEEFDLVFTCPPYWDVETYDKLYGEEIGVVGGQLSAHKSYAAFLVDYQRVIDKCYDALKPDCYAVWVVSDIRRDKKLIDFSGDTIRCFQQAGFEYHDVVVHQLHSPGIVGVGNNVANGYVPKSHEYILVFKKWSD